MRIVLLNDRSFWCMTYVWINNIMNLMEAINVKKYKLRPAWTHIHYPL